MGEPNDSGHTGVAWLGADGDQTEVVVIAIEPEEMSEFFVSECISSSGSREIRDPLSWLRETLSPPVTVGHGLLINLGISIVRSGHVAALMSRQMTPSPQRIVRWSRQGGRHSFTQFDRSAVRKVHRAEEPRVNRVSC